MANPGYVRSTDGSDADNGSTWALANATITGAAADDAAGDTIYFSQAHSENGSTAVSVTFGTNASPQKLICGNDVAEPPTAVATGATIATSNGSSVTVNGSFFAYGLTIKPGGAGAVNAPIVMAQGAGDVQVWKTCVFHVDSTGASSAIQVGSNANVQTPEAYWEECDIKFGGTSNLGIIVMGKLSWRGGSALSGTSTPTAGLLRLTSAGEGANVEINGVNLSNFGTSLILIQTGTVQAGKVVFRNCVLPASWAGSLISNPAIGLRAEMWNCQAAAASAANNYQMWVEDYAGSIKHETTIVHTGGASDGDTPISWKMTGSANAEYPSVLLRSPEIFVPNTTTGASKTLTVEIAQDGTTTALNDDEIWLEVEYLGTADSPKSSFVSDAKADFLTAAAAQANSSESWSGLSGTNKKQALSVPLTPQEEGVYIARVCLAKASTTVYVDPKVTVS